VLFPLLAVVAAVSLLEMNQGHTPGDSSRRPVLDVRKTLDQALAKHRDWHSHHIPCQLGVPNEEALASWHKQRLLALAYPETMEKLLMTRARNSALDPITRSCCISLLGVLSKSGRKGVDEVLLELANSSDRFICSQAIRELSSVDIEGRHPDLYLRKCREQIWGAFEAVSHWADPSIVREMDRMIADCPGNHWPGSDMRLSAQEVLQKLQILASPDCHKILIKILEGPGNEWERVPWALRVAQVQSVPGLLSAVRRRLDRCENILPENASPEERHDDAILEQAGFNFTAQLAHGRVMSLLCCEGYDEALITYAELGGPLNGIEKSRLTTFGYNCDAEKRLEELLASEK
jgi:hypothetical protein